MKVQPLPHSSLPPVAYSGGTAAAGGSRPAAVIPDSTWFQEFCLGGAPLAKDPRGGNHVVSIQRAEATRLPRGPGEAEARPAADLPTPVRVPASAPSGLPWLPSVSAPSLSALPSSQNLALQGPHPKLLERTPGQMGASPDRRGSGLYPPLPESSPVKGGDHRTFLSGGQAPAGRTAHSCAGRGLRQRPAPRHLLRRPVGAGIQPRATLALTGAVFTLRKGDFFF